MCVWIGFVPRGFPPWKGDGEQVWGSSASPALYSILYTCLGTTRSCALPGASPGFPRGPGNLSVITKYKHDNLGPNAYRRL